MSNIHPYNGINYSPPAAAMKVNIRNQISGQIENSVLALIDSGADATNIPIGVVYSLGLQPVDFVEVQDYAGKSHGDKPVYDVRVTFDSSLYDVQAVETEGDFLIGRDIINGIRLILDGPNLEFTI